MTDISFKTDSILITYMPNVRYLTGFRGSTGCVLITRRGRRKLFFTDFRYRDQSKKEVRGYQIHMVRGRLLEGLCSYIKAHRLSLGTLGVEYKRLSHAEYLLLKRLLRGVRLADAGGAVEHLRQQKSRTEVDRIRKASAIADLAMEKLRRYQVTGKTERDIAWLLESLMREAGSGPMPFEIIVASGPRSSMPHGVAGDRVIGKNQFVVVDMGASMDGYCCDITRTYATGKLSARQNEIYDTVREAQRLALEAAAPGVPCAMVDGVARRYIEAAGFGEAFGHSLGHGVGLEAHEDPVLSSRSRAVLSEGMVLTIEPGIYAGRSGVRIEDTVLINRSGSVLLTGSPRQLVTLK